MKTRLAFLAAALSLQGCSSSYQVLARVINGQLAFVPADSRHECISVIRVTAEGPRAPDPAIDRIEDPVQRSDAIDRARAAWSADGISFACKAHYPVFYGSALPDMPALAPAKALRVGQAYSVSVMGPDGSAGDGCFRITEGGQAENLPDHECAYLEPQPAPPPPAAAAPPEPAADPPAQREAAATVAQGGKAARPGPWGGGMVSHSLPPPPAVYSKAPAFVREPIMAIPQDGPGEADLTVWDAPSNSLTSLGRYPSIPECRKAKAQLGLLSDQRAYCTVAPVDPPDLGLH